MKKETVKTKFDPKVKLDNRWHNVENTSVKIYLKSSKMNSQQLAENGIGHKLLAEINFDATIQDLTSVLAQRDYAHLTFAAITENRILLKADIARSSPLFYTVNSDSLLITDHIPIAAGYEINPDSAEEFMAMGFVSGADTMYKNVCGLQAGELVSISDEVRSCRYFYNKTFDNPAPIDESDVDRLAEELDRIFMELFHEITGSMPEEGRIVVPLSGGHDSRLIINYLYKTGFRNVLCYTYGLPGNKQSRVSKQVAEALGYEWHFVEYTGEKWKALHDKGEIEKYIDFAFRGVSTPHLQDFLAVYELFQNKILKPGDVIMPGHGLDILCQVIDVRKYEDNLVEGIVQRFEQRKNFRRKHGTALYSKYSRHRENFPFGDKHLIDFLFWQENQVKYLVNSLRVYEYFGLNHCIAYWDRRVTDFWYSIPMEQKFERNLLRKMEKRRLIHEKLSGIPYCDERVVNTTPKNKKKTVKQRLKSYLPNALIVAVLRLVRTKPALAEGLNLIYSRKINSVGELAGDEDLWPKRASAYFQKEKKRLPFQANHELLVRTHTMAMVLNKNKMQ